MVTYFNRFHRNVFSCQAELSQFSVYHDGSSFFFKSETTFLYFFYIKMSSSESDSKAESEDEDDLLYLMIYDMKTHKEEPKETVESPQRAWVRPRIEPLIIYPDSDDSEDETTQAQRQNDQEGADITDYFNYGFDEESWDAYCKRQIQSRATNTELWNNIAEDTKMSPEEDPITFNDLPAPSKFLPPPLQHSAQPRLGCLLLCSALLCAAANAFHNRLVGHYSQCSNTAPYLYRNGPPPPSPLGALYRLDKGSDDPSTSVSPCSSGVSSVIPGNMTSRVGWIEAAMAWECFICQEMCKQDCDRFRQRCLGKDSKRGSDRDRERTSSSHSSYVYFIYVSDSAVCKKQLFHTNMLVAESLNRESTEPVDKPPS
ncbi:hypothetical protein D9C73_009055 [Collichthys lucidus]|uniref:Pre-mRNA polyadenylation factor Fip1 domain-containing protein n=1 Tax=Collichthys lucidus TaxID=240159 RepID=A0A4V6AQA2_COLLU|nr:hypothetical protein D9C73_009055 [Collichthys lucidus]